MRDILNTITKWWADDETFGLATVVRTFRSAPRDPGAALASGDMNAVETVVPKRGVNTLIPALRAAGARDILEIPISKIVE